VSPRSWLWAALAAIAVSHVVLVVLLRVGKSLADRITIARFVVATGAAALACAGGGVSLAVWVALGVALAGDALDGYVARRRGGSAAGAILDMETDQLALLVLALLAVAQRGAPAVVLVVPALRYLKVAAHAALGLDARSPRPRSGDNREARLLCAIASLALLVAVAPFAGAAIVTAASVVAAAALSWSYRVDLFDLLAARRERALPARGADADAAPPRH
jgi:phosphatidylglycerophosphate synthase